MRSLKKFVLVAINAIAEASFEGVSPPAHLVLYVGISAFLLGLSQL